MCRNEEREPDLNMDKDIKKDLARLSELLDIYGPDAMRWPTDGRNELQSLLQSHPEGRRMLREAQALSQVMDAAPSMTASTDLKAGILAAALGDKDHEAQVIPIAAGRKHRESTEDVQRLGKLWPAAALAASFAVGLYLGVSGVGGQTFDSAFQFAALTSTTSDTDTDSWLDNGSGGFVEDLL